MSSGFVHHLLGHRQLLLVCDSTFPQLNLQGIQGCFCPFALQPAASLTRDLPEV